MKKKQYWVIKHKDRTVYAGLFHTEKEAKSFAVKYWFGRPWHLLKKNKQICVVRVKLVEIKP